eukprot:scaffold219560_cov18-Tisochrysis_lutea.AAC.1
MECKKRPRRSILMRIECNVTLLLGSGVRAGFQSKEVPPEDTPVSWIHVFGDIRAAQLCPGKLTGWEHLMGNASLDPIRNFHLFSGRPFSIVCIHGKTVESKMLHIRDKDQAQGGRKALGTFFYE